MFGEERERESSEGLTKVHRETRTNMTISAGTALALIAFLFTGWTWASEAHQESAQAIAVESTRNDRQEAQLDALSDSLEIVNDRVNNTTISSEVTVRLLNELKVDVKDLRDEIRSLREEN